MARGYRIEYNGKIYNKSELLKELDITKAMWNNAEWRVFRALEEDGIEIADITEAEFFSAIIDTVKAIKENNRIYAEKQSELHAAKQLKLDRPVHIRNNVFHTFVDVEQFINHEAFNYYDYISFKNDRRVANRIEDFISYLYSSDESFKLRLLYVSKVIDNNLYRLASKCLNEYTLVREGRRNVARGSKPIASDNKTMFFKITADDAIKIAYGKMHYNSLYHQISYILPDRQFENQYTAARKHNNK